MTAPRQISFDTYLDTIFASPNWLDMCINMLSVFLEDMEACRDNPEETVPDAGPSIVDQVAAIAGRAHLLEMGLRETAQAHGPEFQTSELGAVLWWAGMAWHKAATGAEAARDRMSRQAWDDALYEIHALMYDTISALSLLSVAEKMMQRMESDGMASTRPN